MTLRGFFRAWNKFFFAPKSTLPICIFRILFGVIGIANLLIMWPEWLVWYGPRGFTTLATVNQFNHAPSMSIFQVLPQTNLAVSVFYWVFLASTVMLTVGYLTRFNAVAVYLFLGSIQMRNGFILNSGDTLMLVTGFFLMFSPCGSALSVDHWLRVRRGLATDKIPVAPPWAQRMLQIQTAVVYFATFYWKSMGTLWVNGTAVYYALSLQDFHRFPTPGLHNMYLMRTLTWSTLLIEFALGVLIWFKELRYPVLLAGLAMHVGIEYSMNIPIFEWMIVATYINFVDPQDIVKFGRWVRGHTAGVFGKIETSHGEIAQEREVAASPIDVTDGQVQV